MSYGVHTLILKHWIDLDQAADILAENEYDRDDFYTQIKRLKRGKSHIFGLSNHPLLRKLDIAVTSIFRGYTAYLRLQIAPSDVLVGCKTEDIFELKEADKQLFYSNLDGILIELFDGFPFIDKECNHWNVNYIEYAGNFFSPNVKLAISMLLKNTKDTKAKAYKEDGYALSISRKSKHKRNSSTELYNKEESVKALHESDYEELKEDVAGYVRFERQLGRSYLWSQIAKKDRNNDNLDYYLDDAIAKQVIITGYTSKFATGDFYSLNYIREYIKDKKLVKYSESSTRSKSIKRTKVKARAGKSSISVATNNSRIRSFDKLGIAPIAIPVRERTNFLFNPFPLAWLPKSEREHKVSNFFKFKDIKLDTTNYTYK